MFRTLLTIVCVAVVAEARPRQLVPVMEIPMIVGGSAAAAGRWPWQLSLQYNDFFGGWYHTCGAVLISSTRALTAAHCTEGRIALDMRVLLGATTVNNGESNDAEQTIVLSDIFEHELWDNSGDGFPNDISMLDLSSAATLGGNVQAATLAVTGDNLEASECWISGWGKTDGASNAASPTLQEAQIPVVSNTQCKSLLAPSGYDTSILDTHVCVYDSNNKVGSCQGDSGGPLHCNVGGTWKVAGVTSWGLGNQESSCLQTTPSVYTRLSEFSAWIANNSR